MTCPICENLEQNTFPSWRDDPSEEMLEEIDKFGCTYVLGVQSDTKSPGICLYYRDDDGNIQYAPINAKTGWCPECGRKLS